MTSRSLLAGILVLLSCSMLQAQTYNKSWIWIDPACNARVLTSGETWEVPIEYNLDPEEAGHAQKLKVAAHGPWLDGPDGKYVKKRHHVNYPDMTAMLDVKPGRHREVVKFTVPQAYPNGNSLLLVASFQDSGKSWPWEVRQGGTWFKRSDANFDLVSDVPGNMFTTAEPVEMKVKLLREDGEGKPLWWRVYGPGGDVLAKGEVKIGAEKEIKLPLQLAMRGIFLLEVEVAGWERRTTTFAVIPDVGAARTEPTRFGMHSVLSPAPAERIEEQLAIARRLGLSACRIFASWRNFEPAPGDYRFDAWDVPMNLAKKYGVQPVLLIYNPPAWAQRGTGRPTNIKFEPFEADWDAWGAFVTKTTQHFGDRLYAWEWLNEIVPGKDPNAVANYIRFCQVGTEAAKAVNPNIITNAAGGLWPRNFRNALLAAGLAKYVDVLPVHYSNDSGVRQAKADLHTVGSDIAVWNNESACVLNAWDVPAQDQIADTTQPQYLLTKWTQSLTGGAERIFWFGGQADPAGNWSYLLDGNTPRPVAVSLAVFTSKMYKAKPLGAFTLGSNSELHLFDRDGKVIVVAWAPKPVQVCLPTTNNSVVQTDYLGNEKHVAAQAGEAELQLTSMPIFIEGLDPQQVKPFVAMRSLLTEDATQQPRLTILPDKQTMLQFDVKNVFDEEFSGDVILSNGDQVSSSAQFKLQPGEHTIVELPITLEVEQADVNVVATLQSTLPTFPAVQLPIVTTVITPDMMGNLLCNGGFEEGKEWRPAHWGSNIGRVSSADLGEGLGQWVLRFHNTKGRYATTSQTIKLRDGDTYLYSAWIWNDNIGAGSNIGLKMKNGSTKTLYNTKVFLTPNSTPGWQLYSMKLKTSEQLAKATFVPLCKGDGWALFDNLRVTRYEGTSYMAEAHRVEQPVTMDGDLSEWKKRCPIPLFGGSQLRKLNPKYAWSPENISGVAYMQWDQNNLYLVVRLRDDQHVARTTGEQTIDSDSLLLAIDPTGRAADAAERAFVYYLSAASPGGGSGKHTIFRPAESSGGLAAGQLLKDSSVYDMSVKHDQGTTTYEVRIPWSEMGINAPKPGTRFGMTLQANDNDGSGVAAQIHWGDGTTPAQAMNFGLITLLE